MNKVFPESYPSDLMQRIIEDGAAENIIENVYRIANYGENNRDAFLSTFLTNIKDSGNTNIRDAYIFSQENYDIGMYGTSLSSNEKKAKRTLSLLERKYNGPILLIGTILPEYGMSIFSKNSKTRKSYSKYHIDWWIYKDKDPSKHFKVLEEL